MTDYIVVGGGLAGCVLSTRLKEFNPSAEVTLLETGTNEDENPLIIQPMNAFQLHFGPLKWNYTTSPQKHYDGKKVYSSLGKVLSGSSAVNMGAWTRGGRDDYDIWGNLVQDKRWSYDGLLPCFKATETHFDPNGDPEQHGFGGPIHTTGLARNYPLRDEFREALIQGTGLPLIPDGNNGNFVGIAPLVENWTESGTRQPAGQAYGLKGVNVKLNSTVKRILFEGDVAVGVELLDGTVMKARKEVILCCGAIKTPQLLMLSGVGPAQELSKLGIESLIDSPDVGKNFSDHGSACMFFKIKNAEKGLAIGSPLFNDTSFFKGMPADSVVMAPAPFKELKAAMIADGFQNVSDDHVHLRRTRGHIEILPAYCPTEAPMTDLNMPFDGATVTFATLNVLPTSRGSITLNSTDPMAEPVIDPNYFATETDRVVSREAIRMVLRTVESKKGQEIFEAEIPPKDFKPLTSSSSNEDIDARIRRVASTWWHYGGTASMGKVVNTDLQVIGAKHLRVVDASIIPTPIAGHYQVVCYALAEQAARIISNA